MSFRSYDRIFFLITVLLVISGLFIFSSASVGILAYDTGDFAKIFLKQLFLGVGGGFFAMWFFSLFNHRYLSKISIYVFIISAILTMLVFVPDIGVEIKGAKRWLIIGPLSFQPSEFLKLGFVLYFATYLTTFKNKIQTIKYGIVIPLLIVAIPSVIILSQPDTGTLLSILSAWLAMFIVAGGRWKHLLILIFLGIILLGVVVYLKPYAMERVLTFLNPLRDPLGAGYQTRQALLAIGSGEVWGRGFGQGIQKFKFLPEPLGDSIYAVASEEFGFVGSVIILLLFTFFALRGLKIASKASDFFGRLLATGLVILITSQSFVNIGAMVGLLPLTGIPLIFISHGGTAMLFALSEVGMILNVSKYSR